MTSEDEKFTKVFAAFVGGGLLMAFCVNPEITGMVIGLTVGGGIFLVVLGAIIGLVGKLFGQ